MMKKILIVIIVLFGNSTTFIASGEENSSELEERNIWGQSGLNADKARPICKYVGRARGVPEHNWDFNFAGDYDNYINKVQHCFPNDVLSNIQCLEQAVFYRSQDECFANSSQYLWDISKKAGLPMFYPVCSGGDQWWDFWGYGCFGLAKDMYYVATIGKLKAQLLQTLQGQAANKPPINAHMALSMYHACVSSATRRSEIEQCYKNALKVLQ